MKRLMMLLGCLALLGLVGCGMSPAMPGGGDSQGGSSKTTKSNDQETAKECYSFCRSKGGSEEKCKGVCYEDKDDKDGASAKECYKGCLSKGIGEEKCKAICSGDKDDDGDDGDDDEGKACYEKCVKAGKDKMACKKACAEDKEGPECKLVKGKDGSVCKVCRDGKKYCEDDKGGDTGGDAKACYEKCVKAGKEPADCKQACAGSTGGKGDDPKACFEKCVNAGKEPADCKQACGGGYTPGSDEKACVEKCIKAGKDPAACKKSCASSGGGVTCKEVKQQDGSVCKVCSDGSKSCSKGGVTCKEVKQQDGSVCKVCSDGSKSCSKGGSGSTGGDPKACYEKCIKAGKDLSACKQACFKAP